MAYHIELRTKAIQAYEEGEGSQEEIASLLQISLSTLKRWLAMSRKGHPLQPMTENCGRPKKIDDAGEATIQSLVINNPSITLSELSAAYYKRHKVIVSRSVLSRTLQALNLRYKKLSIKSIEKQTDEIQKKRKNTSPS